MEIIFSKKFRIVYFITSILFTILMVDSFFSPYALFFGGRVFTIMLMFYGLFMLVHSSFALFNSNFMKSHMIEVIFKTCVCSLIVAIVAIIFYQPLIWIWGIWMLSSLIIIYVFFPPEVEIIVN